MLFFVKCILTDNINFKSSFKIFGFVDYPDKGTKCACLYPSRMNPALMARFHCAVQGQYTMVRFGTEHPDPACSFHCQQYPYLIGKRPEMYQIDAIFINKPQIWVLNNYILAWITVKTTFHDMITVIFRKWQGYLGNDSFTSPQEQTRTHYWEMTIACSEFSSLLVHFQC